MGYLSSWISNHFVTRKFKFDFFKIVPARPPLVLRPLLAPSAFVLRSQYVGFIEKNLSGRGLYSNAGTLHLAIVDDASARAVIWYISGRKRGGRGRCNFGMPLYCGGGAMVIGRREGPQNYVGYSGYQLAILAISVDLCNVLCYVGYDALFEVTAAELRPRVCGVKARLIRTINDDGKDK